MDLGFSPIPEDHEFLEKEESFRSFKRDMSTFLHAEKSSLGKLLGHLEPEQLREELEEVSHARSRRLRERAGDLQDLKPARSSATKRNWRQDVSRLAHKAADAEGEQALPAIRTSGRQKLAGKRVRRTVEVSRLERQAQTLREELKLLTSKTATRGKGNPHSLGLDRRKQRKPPGEEVKAREQLILESDSSLSEENSFESIRTQGVSEASEAERSLGGGSLSEEVNEGLEISDEADKIHADANQEDAAGDRHHASESGAKDEDADAAAAQHASEGQGVGESASQRSIDLFESTSLSVLNKYWQLCKSKDVLLECLDQEECDVRDSINQYDAKVQSFKERQAKQAAKVEERDKKEALNAFKDSEKQAKLTKIALANTVKYYNSLQATADKAANARKLYQTFNEKVKWKDDLSPEEEVELSNLRMQMHISEQKLEKERSQYDKRVFDSFVQAARNEQEKLRLHTNILFMSEKNIQIQKALQLAHAYAYDYKDTELNSILLHNRLFCFIFSRARALPSERLLVVMYTFYSKMRQRALDMKQDNASFVIKPNANYRGQWLGSQAHGLGVEMSPHGCRYQGQYYHDLRHGLGAFISKSVIYEGMWWRGRRHGAGVEGRIVHQDYGEEVLPVALVQYEHGRRVGLTRFNPRVGMHVYLLEMVRRVRVNAQGVAREAEGSLVLEELVSESAPTTPASSELSYKQLLSLVDESNSQDKCGRKEGVGCARASKKTSQHDMYKRLVDSKQGFASMYSQIGDSIKSLNQSSMAGMKAIEKLVEEKGLKTGRLYGLTAEEAALQQSQAPKLPSQEMITNVLQSQDVPAVLIERIVDLYFKLNLNQSDRPHQDVKGRTQTLLDLTHGSTWHVHNSENDTFKIRKVLLSDANEQGNNAGKKKKGSRAWLFPTINLAGKGEPLIKVDRPKQMQLGRYERANASFPGTGREMKCLLVPSEVTFEQAVFQFNRKTHRCIIVQPGNYKLRETILVDKELHIVGEDGVRIHGKFVIQSSYPCSFTNLIFMLEAQPNSKEFQKLIHVQQGEVTLDECALLCSSGYSLWVQGRSMVECRRSILAGSDDCLVEALAACVMMEYARANFQTCWFQDCEESCVFLEHDAQCRIFHSKLHSSDIGIILNNRSSAVLSDCVLKLFRKGVFGEMTSRSGSDNTELLLRKCEIQGNLWGLGVKPQRFVRSDCKITEC